MESIHCDYIFKLEIIRTILVSHQHQPPIFSHSERAQFCKQRFVCRVDYEEFLQDHLYLSLAQLEKCKNKLTTALNKFARLHEVQDDRGVEFVVNDIVEECESFSPAMPWNWTPSEYNDSLWYIPTSFPPDYYALEFVRVTELFWKNQGKSCSDNFDVRIKDDFIRVEDKTGWTVFSCCSDREEAKMHYLNLRLLGDDIERFLEHTVSVLSKRPTKEYLANTVKRILLRQQNQAASKLAMTNVSTATC